MVDDSTYKHHGGPCILAAALPSPLVCPPPKTRTGATTARRHLGAVVS